MSLGDSRGGFFALFGFRFEGCCPAAFAPETGMFGKNPIIPATSAIASNSRIRSHLRVFFAETEGCLCWPNIRASMESVQS